MIGFWTYFGEPIGVPDGLNVRYEENKKDKWYMPVLSVLGRLRQEDHRFKVSLSYFVRSSAT